MLHRVAVPPSFFFAALLVLLNTIIPVATKLSRTGKDLYTASTLVFVIESFKTSICFLIIHFSINSRSLGNTLRAIYQRSAKDYRLMCKMIVISLFYSVQGNLNLYAISNLDGIVFLITSQLKIVTTAYFSWKMRKTNINFVQKCALVLLILGTIIVQSSSISSPKNGERDGNGLLGLLSVILATVSSGFAGISFESSLHSKQFEEKEGEIPIIWLLNIHLAVSGIFFSGILMLLFDGTLIWEKGPFYGYRIFTFFLALLMALCGFVIAYIVKHADSIIKGFASALCIVTSGVIMDLLSHQPGSSFTLSKIVGSTTVISSILMYNYSLQIQNRIRLPMKHIVTISQSIVCKNKSFH